ncbi:uncharacterized protein LOC136063239 [Quercus suber]|uniref:uncharacterized protein LOC136063239 n=1 Tax=Quercus suber TaxID=58331 RepID=UPI0032DF2CD3
MRVFLCSMDETVWDAVDIGWTKPEAPKANWDKDALAAANANSKALNAIFCDVSLEEFHRISHISIAKEAWEILETTYEGTKKVKDTKLQMLTTRFEELKMSEEESFDSFYSKLNEVVVGKFNLGEKTEDSKIVRKIFRSLPETFRPKVTAIEESKDLDDIKVQELVGSLQTYELSMPSQKKSKSLALKTIDERVASHDISEEDGVEKEVAYLAKNFRKFLKMKNSRKPFNDRKFSSSRGKVYATTLSDADSSNSDSKDGCDGEGNYSAFMTIAHVETLDELGTLVKELGEHSDLESMGIVEESEDEEVGETVGLQETYNSLLEKTGEYAKMANATIKKMKRAEEDYKSLLARYKEAKCEIETLNDKSGLGYTGGSSSSAKVTKEVKFVKTNETVVDKPALEIVEAKKKQNVANQREFNKSRNQSEVRFGARGRSLPR